MEDQCSSENDYELLYMIYQMDEVSLQMLVSKYEVMCEVAIHGFLTGVEEDQFDDLMTECIALIFHSVYNFRIDQNTNFSTFFKQVLKYYLTNYYRKRNTYQGKCMAKQVSLDAMVSDYDCKLLDTIPNHDLSLEGIYYLYQEGFKYRLKMEFRNLEDWEQKVVELRMKGYRYKEIAEMLKIEVRQVEYVLLKLRNGNLSLT